MAVEDERAIADFAIVVGEDHVAGGTEDFLVMVHEDAVVKHGDACG